MSRHYERALLLFEQSRFELAEEQLRLVLAEEPESAEAHALLALCLVERKQFEKAVGFARRAVHRAPDEPFPHYALAHVLYRQDHNAEALQAIQEALRLDAANPTFFALLGSIHLDARRWEEALEAAEEGLRVDAEDVACTNLRAMALVKLGRRSEAGESIEVALARDPEEPLTHANQGWTLLESGDARGALEHFREALRLDPENEWARTGIVEALKARHYLYALALRYFLWMSKLSPTAQWGVVIGVVVFNRVLSSLARMNLQLAPVFLILKILLFLVIILTWTADPFFNLLLRLSRFGRLVLPRDKLVASNWFGLCAFAALLSLVLAAVYGWSGFFLKAALVFGVLLVPVAGTFRAAPGWPRWSLGSLSVALGLVGASSFVLPALGRGESWSVPALGLFILGAVLFTWVANVVYMKQPRR